MENFEDESREAQAEREVGSTDVSRRVATVLTVVFLLLILIVPVIEIVLDARQPGSHWSELTLAPARAGQSARSSGTSERTGGSPHFSSLGAARVSIS